MSEHSARPEESLPLPVLLWIDAACQSFETAWKAARDGGTRPRIEDYLVVAPGAERGALLQKLLAVEQHYRRNERVSLDEYLGRLPEHAALLRRVFGPPGGAAGLSAGDDPLRTTPEFLPPPPMPPAPSITAVRGLPQVPGYEVRSELGRGGMGVVYLARQTRLKRLVALKMILASAYAGEQELARFRMDAEAGARLQHPHIVQVHEIGEHDDLPFFSLEFVDGGTLAAKLAGTPQPPNEAARLVETLARTMHFAHERGIIHRDLKPANVLLTADSVPKVTDFGLAKQLNAGAGQTHTGQVMGTPSYMAPEQAAGCVREIGPRTDVYSLGAILYEMLTGRPPFRAATPADTLIQVRQREPERPRSLRPAVPRDLETVCLKALAKAPAERYPSARDFAEDLACFLHRRPIRARPVGPWESCWRWGRRNPALASLSATAAGLLAAVLLLLLLRLGPEPGTEQASPEPGTVADASLQRVLGAGKLVIATHPPYPPMEFEKDGQLEGFDIDLGNALASQLGVCAKFKPINWDWQAVMAGLSDGEFDVVISGITITDDRKQQVVFVEYLSMPLAFVCRQGITVHTEAELAGKVVAVQRDTPGEKRVEDLKQKGLRIRDIKPYTTTPEVFKALQEERADVTIAHTRVARHATREFHLDIMDNILQELDPEQIGIALRKKDKALYDRLVEAVKETKQNPGWPSMVKKWFPEPQGR
jgi:serine/threonine protein kinase/ABC-type amino acid transport substrate-binding protein